MGGGRRTGHRRRWTGIWASYRRILTGRLASRRAMPAVWAITPCSAVRCACCFSASRSRASPRRAAWETSPPGPLSREERGNDTRQDGGLSPSPRGRGVAEGRGEVPVYLVQNGRHFEREHIYGYADDGERFILFCRAALEMCRALG